MLETLLFTIGVTLPVCIMLLAGIVLKKRGFIDDHFVNISSRLVFTFGLPAVLFFSLSSIDHTGTIDINLLLFACVASISGFLIAWLLSLKVVAERRDRGGFIQGAARGNLAVIGLALAGNMYGEEGIAQLSLIMAVTVPLYNILSILFLTYYSKEQAQSIHLGHILSHIVTNPLILAVVAGVAFSYTNLTLPHIVVSVGGYFSQITLPLALLGVGGTLSLNTLKQTSNVSFGASLFKVMGLPLLMIPVAILLGYRGIELGTLFLMLSCPTAAASFVMAKAYNSNADLAANIILLTTLGALPAISFGLFLLKVSGLL